MKAHGQFRITPWVQAAVAEYERRLLSYASRLVSDPDRARDVVQETFLRLCREDQSSLDGHLAEWLYAVCRSRALDLRRKEKRMNALTDEKSATLASPEPAPDVRMQQSESTSQVLALLGGLPENQQEVLRLKFQHGMSYRQIGGITGLSVSNVGFLIHTGLKTIRQKLKIDNHGKNG